MADDLRGDAAPQSETIAKVRTHISGMDEVLRGGLPEGRATALIGGPGTGKTVFGVEFLYRSALAGEPSIFISFEEPAEAIRRNAASLGWDLKALEEQDRLRIIDGRTDPRAIRAGEFDLSGLLAILDGASKEIGATNIVIDAIDRLLYLLDDPRREREQLEILHRWLAANQLTAVLTVKATNDQDEGGLYKFLDYLVDCIIELDQRVVGQVTKRRLRVVKYRGSGYAGNEFPFVISPTGIRLIPITGMGLSSNPALRPISTGLDRLDEFLGGGLLSPSVVLISGGSGTGKTTLAATIAQAACRRNDRILYMQYEEAPCAMIQRLPHPGIELESDLESGCLRIESTMPEEAGVEEHLIHTLAAIEEHEAEILIIDAISATLRMSTDAAAYEFLVRLTNWCRAMGVTCIFTYQSRRISLPDRIMGMGISSLIDTTILLHYAEEDDRLHRTLLVLKSRGMNHSLSQHRFRITENGLCFEHDPDGAATEGRSY